MSPRQSRPPAIDERRLGLVRALLAHCEAAYDADSADLKSTENVVATYKSRAGQQKYVHMYLAKSVACWRHLRRTLRAPNDGQVWSVGAGPCLCLLGWFFDVPPDDDQRVAAVDALRWKFIRDLDSHATLLRDVLGSAAFEFLHHRHFPSSGAPQLQGVVKSEPLKPGDIPSGATVLIPFVLNHLVGWVQPMQNQSLLWQWLEAVRLRASRVVVADMQCDPNKGTDGFWRTVSEGLGVTGDATVLSFDSDLKMFAPAFSERDNWPSRRTSAYMSEATVVVGDSRGWRYA